MVTAMHKFKTTFLNLLGLTLCALGPSWGVGTEIFRTLKCVYRHLNSIKKRIKWLFHTQGKALVVKHIIYFWGFTWCCICNSFLLNHQQRRVHCGLLHDLLVFCHCVQRSCRSLQICMWTSSCHSAPLSYWLPFPLQSKGCEKRLQLSLLW